MWGTCPPVFLLFRSVYVFAFLFACVCTNGPRKAKADALLCLTHSERVSQLNPELSAQASLAGQLPWGSFLSLLSTETADGLLSPSGLCVGSADANFGPPAYMVEMLSHLPSPSTPFLGTNGGNGVSDTVPHRPC